MTTTPELNEQSLEARFFKAKSWLATHFGEFLSFNEGIATSYSVVDGEVCEKAQLGGFHVNFIVAGTRTLVVPSKLEWCGDKAITGVVLPLRNEVAASNSRAVRSKLLELLKDMLRADQLAP